MNKIGKFKYNTQNTFIIGIDQSLDKNQGKL